MNVPFGNINALISFILTFAILYTKLIIFQNFLPISKVKKNN